MVTNNKIIGHCVLICLTLFLWCKCCFAETVDFDRLANCIRIAEGNANYGVMVKFKHTTPRQACINTAKRVYEHVWDGVGGVKGYIKALGAIYCPTKGKLRPAERRLNGNWVKNVTYLYLYGGKALTVK